MELRHLDTFRSVVEQGSFTGAAKKLNTTQSNVSLRVAELERELGVTLVDRTRRKARVTPKGRDLLRYASQIALLLDEMRNTVGHAKTISGSFRINAAELVALTWLPMFIALLSRQFPRLEIDLEVSLSAAVGARLREREFDLAIVPVAHDPGPDIATSVLAEVAFAYHASTQLDVPDRPLGPTDFETLTVISLGAGSVVSAVEQEWLNAAKRLPMRLNRSNSMEISAGLVRSGLGVSLLPKAFYRAEREAGHMRLIETKPPIEPISFRLMYLRSNTSPVLDAILSLVTEVSANEWTR
ncbi:MAG: LysR family transcriptional regulator [Pseudomonadota bacterium]